MSETGQESRGEEAQGAPLQRAVALHYDAASSTAPRVVATGRGELAERILTEAIGQIAREGKAMVVDRLPLQAVVRIEATHFR